MENSVMCIIEVGNTKAKIKTNKRTWNSASKQWDEQEVTVTLVGVKIEVTTEYGTWRYAKYHTNYGWSQRWSRKVISSIGPVGKSARRDDKYSDDEVCSRLMDLAGFEGAQHFMDAISRIPVAPPIPA